MNVVPLGEICRPKQWRVLSKAEMLPSGFPVYGANGVIGYASEYTHEHPTLLVGCRGTIGAVHLSASRAFVTTNAMALDRLDVDRADPTYLGQFLTWRGFRDLTSGSSQPQLTRQNLVKLEVPLPAIEEQRRIAAILDQADALLAKRRQVLAHLDSLPQAFYREMFDGHSWPVATVGDVAERVTDGEHKTPRRSESGVPLISARNVRDGWIDFENVDYIDEPEFQSLSRRIHPRSGDVLISCSGSIGRVAQVGSRARFAMVRSAALVRPSSVIDSTFLQHHLSTPAVRAIMVSRANSSAQANLFQNQIKELPVNLPPMHLQVQFRSQVEQLATSRAAVERIIRGDDELFASLQSRAFRGEL